MEQLAAAVEGDLLLVVAAARVVLVGQQMVATIVAVEREEGLDRRSTWSGRKVEVVAVAVAAVRMEDLRLGRSCTSRLLTVRGSRVAGASTASSWSHRLASSTAPQISAAQKPVPCSGSAALSRV